MTVWCWRRLLRAPWTTTKSNHSTLNIHWKDWCWNWGSNTLATWCKDSVHCKSPWCLIRLRAERKGGDRKWNSWILSQTQWTRVWANSGRYERTSKLGMLQSTGLQRVGHDLVTKQQQATPPSQSISFFEEFNSQLTVNSFHYNCYYYYWKYL